MRRVVWMLVLTAACGTTAPLPEVEPGAGAPPELGASLNVGVGEDSVQLELHVTNVTSAPLVLEFASGQRYDFAVARTTGEVVWRWSQDRAFTQALASDTLAAGESLRYSVRWPADAAGDYVGTAWLTARNYPVELRTTFRVPAE